MTVGIALLADRPPRATETNQGAQTIILVADKQMTYSDDLREESEVEKKRQLLKDWHFLFAGDPDFAELFSLRFRKAGGEIKRIDLVRERARLAYQWCRRRSLEDEVLGDLDLTERDVAPRNLGNLPNLLGYFESRAEWKSRISTDFLFAGFNPDGWRAALFTVAWPGVLGPTYVGSSRTIGIGADAARYGLLKSKLAA